MNIEDWIAANTEPAAKALLRASGDLYALLGGQADPERQREVLAAEVATLELTMKRRRAYDRKDA